MPLSEQSPSSRHGHWSFAETMPGSSGVGDQRGDVSPKHCPANAEARSGLCHVYDQQRAGSSMH